MECTTTFILSVCKVSLALSLSQSRREAYPSVDFIVSVDVGTLSASTSSVDYHNLKANVSLGVVKVLRVKMMKAKQLTKICCHHPPQTSQAK